MTATRLGPLCLPSALSIALLAAAGCMGSVGNGDGNGLGTPGVPPTGDPGSPGSGVPTGGSPTIPGSGDLGSAGGCKEDAPAVTALRRLTHAQYVNTVRDLIGDATAAVGGQLPQDDANDDIFADPRNLIVSPDWASAAMDAAEAAAKAAMTKLSSLVPCNAASGDQACADKFVAGFGKRAFRRPLDQAELAAYGGLYATAAQNGGFPHGIEVVVRALLQSPSFLYRVELGQKSGSSGASVRLAQYEVAARLSYMLWNTMPDETLLSAAEGGQLATGDQIVAHARRMMADPRARATLGDFHGKWLGLDALSGVAKDPVKYPAFNEEMIQSLRSENRLFVEEVLWKGGGRLESLFDANYTFVDAKLAPVYGVTAPASGFAKVELPGAERAGLLTSASVIAAHTFADESAAIHRGKFVRESLLCVVPPDPPADLMVEPPMPKPGVSTRERLSEHTSLPACAGCHVLMDPIGFGFEAYDGIGRFHTTGTDGKPVDDSGSLDMVKDFNGAFAFKGAVELSKKLASSAQVRECLVNTVLKFAQGPDAASDVCVRSKMATAFDAAKHDIRELFIAIAKTDGFRFRRSIAGEVLP